MSLGLLTACDDKASNGKNSMAIEPEKLSVLEQYQHQANNLLFSIRTKRTAEVIASESKLLVSQSQILLSEFIHKYPQCNKYLTALNKAVKTITSLSREAIESGYKVGHKLPSFDAPVCYHAKNLLVNPATTYVIASQGIDSVKVYQDAEMEIVKTIAHLEVVQNAVNKVALNRK